MARRDIDKLLNLGAKQLDRLELKDIKNIVDTLNEYANENLERLERANLSSISKAYTALANAKGIDLANDEKYRFRTSDGGKRELKTDYMNVANFLKLKTSNVYGTETYIENLLKRTGFVNQGDDGEYYIKFDKLSGALKQELINYYNDKYGTNLTVDFVDEIDISVDHYMEALEEGYVGFWIFEKFAFIDRMEERMEQVVGKQFLDKYKYDIRKAMTQMVFQNLDKTEDELYDAIRQNIENFKGKIGGQANEVFETSKNEFKKQARLRESEELK